MHGHPIIILWCVVHIRIGYGQAIWLLYSSSPALARELHAKERTRTQARRPPAAKALRTKNRTAPSAVKDTHR